MSETNERLARIETKLDAALGTLTDHEKRVRSLESWRNWLLGAAAVVGFLADKAWASLTSN